MLVTQVRQFVRIFQPVVVALAEPFLEPFLGPVFVRHQEQMCHVYCGDDGQQCEYI
jgi:hypothetical protein